MDTTKIRACRTTVSPWLLALERTRCVNATRARYLHAPNPTPCQQVDRLYPDFGAHVSSPQAPTVGGNAPGSRESGVGKWRHGCSHANLHSNANSVTNPDHHACHHPVSADGPGSRGESRVYLRFRVLLRCRCSGPFAPLRGGGRGGGCS